MKRVSVDTNVLLDYFFRRTAGFIRAWKIIRQSSKGEIGLYLCLPVILEYVWVARSTYKLAKKDIIETIQALLDLPECEVTDKLIVSQALILYRNNAGISFDDCLIITMSKDAKVDDFITHDLKLKRLYKKLK